MTEKSNKAINKANCEVDKFDYGNYKVVASKRENKMNNESNE